MKKFVLVGVLLAGFCYADPPPELPQAPQVSSGTPTSIALTGETQFSSETPHGMDVGPRDTFYSLTRRALTKADYPENVDIVTMDDPRVLGARNAGEAVMRLSGVLVLPQGEANTPLGAGMRGATDRQTLVMVDGRSVSGVALEPADLTAIPLEQIDRIEVVRGGMSALYGPNATGGVINVISKRAAYNGLPLSHVSYEARSYSSHQTRLDFGSRWNRFDFTFYGNAYRLGGFRDNTDTRATNIGGNLGYTFHNGGKLQFDLSNFHRHTGVPGIDPNTLMPVAFNNKDEKLGVTEHAASDQDTTYVRSSYIVPLPHDMRLAWRTFDTEHHLEYVNTDDPSSAYFAHTEDRTQSKGSELQWDGPWGLSAGGTFTRDRLDHTDRLTAGRAYVASEEDWAFFAQELLQAGIVHLAASGRYDQTTRAGHFLSPRAQAWIDATDYLRFSASAARSFTLPRLADLFTVTPTFSGNPGLRPEKASTYDAGFELHRDSDAFRVTFYKSIVSDAIQSDPFFSSVVYNIADVRRQGVEISASHRLSAAAQTELDYTYVDNRGRLAGGTDRVTLAHSPRHRFDWLWTFHPGRRRRLRLDADLRYEGSRYADDGGSGEKFGSQATVDLRVTWPWRQLDLYIGSQNALNKRYEEVRGYPLPGRTLYGGVSLRLWG